MKFEALDIYKRDIFASFLFTWTFSFSEFWHPELLRPDSLHRKCSSSQSLSSSLSFSSSLLKNNGWWVFGCIFAQVWIAFPSSLLCCVFDVFTIFTILRNLRRSSFIFYHDCFNLSKAFLKECLCQRGFQVQAWCNLPFRREPFHCLLYLPFFFFILLLLLCIFEVSDSGYKRLEKPWFRACDFWFFFALSVFMK